MLTLALVFVPFLVPTAALVDCYVACSKCLAGGTEPPDILEVYCAMCEECKERRREQRRRMNLKRQIINLEDYPEGCPTQPPCDSDLEVVPDALSETVRTTTSTTSTTTRKPCPPVRPCKKPKAPIQCYPCLPLCPCPYPQFFTNVQRKVETSTGDSTGHFYMYVGLPKDVAAGVRQ